MEFPRNTSLVPHDCMNMYQEEHISVLLFYKIEIDVEHFGGYILSVSFVCLDFEHSILK